MKQALSITAMLAAALLLLCSSSAYSQSYSEDTVWTKQTDQAAGFWKVKFSNNDSIIVGHGYEYTMFYNAQNGDEIIRIPGNDEIFYFDNDTKFIRVNNASNNFQIFDAKTFLLIDSLVTEGLIIPKSPFADVSINQSYFLSQVNMGFVIWDIRTNQILKTKMFPTEPHLITLTFSQLKFINNDNSIMGKLGKVYEDPLHPGDSKYYKKVSYFIVYDINSLDSNNYFPYFSSYRLTTNNQIIAVATGDPTYGVEIYDFNTKMLLHKLPVNGPSLTGIEFSPDDKYIVTSNGPGQNSLIVWDVFTGEKKYGYSETSFSNMDISNNGKNLIFSVGRGLRMLFTHFGNTTINLKGINPSVIYPNPATGEVTIDLSNHTLKGMIERVRVYDVKGMCVITSPPAPLHSGEGSKVRLDVSHLPPGVYFVQIGSRVQRFVKL